MYKKIGWLVVCIAVLVGCGNNQNEMHVETNTSETLAEAQTEGERIDSEALGFPAYVAKAADGSIVQALATEDGALVLKGQRAGETMVCVQNSYGESIEVTAKVSSDLKVTVEFEPFKMPEKYVYATDYGMSTESYDNGEALQAAIDALPEGGTIYIPKGIYVTSLVQLKEGITIRLEGILEDYNTAYSEQLDARIASGSEFAVIEAIRGGYDMFINHERAGLGREGADNITITGGVIDMNGKSRCFIFTCAENVLLENVIMKDGPNNHAIQITGCENVMVRNVMFAGYALSSNTTTAEVIQIEETNPSSIGSSTTAATVFDEYEFISSKNVTIENCYFGRSIDYGAPTFAIGHHGARGGYSAEGIQILGCTFDNPKACAIRVYGWNDVEIRDCSFLSELGYDTQEGHCMIDFNFVKEEDVQLPSGAYLKLGYERGGCDNVRIFHNEFLIGTESKLEGIVQSLRDNAQAFDAKAESNLKAVRVYTDEPYSFTGYRTAVNQISNLQIYENQVDIQSTAVQSYITLSGVDGVLVENNELSMAASTIYSSMLEDVKIKGTKLTKCTSYEEAQREVVVSATSANKSAPIVLVGAGEERIEAFCTAADTSKYYNFTVIATEGGTLKRSVTEDGSFLIETVAEDGYTFEGFYDDDTKLTAGRFGFSKKKTLKAVFKAK